MTLASYAAIACSLAFLGIGWKLRGWHDLERSNRECGAVLARIAREENYVDTRVVVRPGRVVVAEMWQ